jgi:hypothetical protein
VVHGLCEIWEVDGDPCNPGMPRGSGQSSPGNW